jgi:hypothetical protein
MCRKTGKFDAGVPFAFLNTIQYERPAVNVVVNPVHSYQFAAEGAELQFFGPSIADPGAELVPVLSYSVAVTSPAISVPVTLLIYTLTVFKVRAVGGAKLLAYQFAAAFAEKVVAVPLPLNSPIT